MREKDRQRQQQSQREKESGWQASRQAGRQADRYTQKEKRKEKKKIHRLRVGQKQRDRLNGKGTAEKDKKTDRRAQRFESGQNGVESIAYIQLSGHSQCRSTAGGNTTNIEEVVHSALDVFFVQFYTHALEAMKFRLKGLSRNKANTKKHSIHLPGTFYCRSLRFYRPRHRKSVTTAPLRSVKRL